MCFPGLRCRRLAQGLWYLLTLASGRCGLVSLGVGPWSSSTLHPLVLLVRLFRGHTVHYTLPIMALWSQPNFQPCLWTSSEQHNYRMFSCASQGYRRLESYLRCSYCLGPSILEHVSVLFHIGVEDLYIRLVAIPDLCLEENWEFPPLLKTSKPSEHYYYPVPLFQQALSSINCINYVF